MPPFSTLAPRVRSHELVRTHTRTPTHIAALLDDGLPCPTPAGSGPLSAKRKSALKVVTGGGGRDGRARSAGCGEATAACCRAAVSCRFLQHQVWPTLARAGPAAPTYQPRQDGRLPGVRLPPTRSDQQLTWLSCLWAALYRGRWRQALRDHPNRLNPAWRSPCAHPWSGIVSPAANQTSGLVSAAMTAALRCTSGGSAAAFQCNALTRLGLTSWTFWPVGHASGGVVFARFSRPFSGSSGNGASLDLLRPLSEAKMPLAAHTKPATSARKSGAEYDVPVAPRPAPHPEPPLREPSTPATSASHECSKGSFGSRGGHACTKFIAPFRATDMSASCFIDASWRAQSSLRSSSTTCKSHPAAQPSELHAASKTQLPSPSHPSHAEPHSDTGVSSAQIGAPSQPTSWLAGRASTEDHRLQRRSPCLPHRRTCNTCTHTRCSW